MSTRPERLGPEWWAVYAATWAQKRLTSPEVTVQQPDRTYVTTLTPRSKVAAACAFEADEALAAWEEWGGT